MRLLLDTNIVMYLINDTTDLSFEVEKLLSDYENQLFVSAPTLRELAANWHKYSYMQRRWKSPTALIECIREDYFINVLYPQREHYKIFLDLTWNEAEDHRDTTDLLIIAHAITLNLPLISSDRKFPFYRAQGLDLIYNKK